MANLNNWKNKIRPTFASNDLSDAIDNLEKELNTFTIPTLSILTTSEPYSSSFWKTWSEFYIKELKYQGFKFKDGEPDNSIELMTKLCNNLLIILPWLKKEVKGKVMTVDGLDMRQANLLQMIELIDFSVDYVGNFTNALSSYETINKGTKVKVTPTIVENLTDNAWVFVTAASILLKPLNDIKAGYGRVPALVADYDKFQELVQTIGTSKADPLNLSVPPFPLSLLFYPQMILADAQMTRLEKAEANYKAISYRIALNKRIMDAGKGDAATESKIETYERELAKSERFITRAKQKWNLED